MNRHPQYYDSDVFLLFGCRTPHADAKRDTLMQAMRTERPDTHLWVSLSIAAEHFAGIVGGSDADSLKKVLGRRWVSFVQEDLQCVQFGHGQGSWYMKGLSSTNELHEVMSLCTDLTHHKDAVQLLIILHQGNLAAIKEAGGHPAIAKSLTAFRQDVVQQLCAKHERIIEKSTTYDAEKQLAAVAHDLYSCGLPYEIKSSERSAIQWKNLTTNEVVPHYLVIFSIASSSSQRTPRLRLHGHIDLEESPEEVGVTRTDPPLPIVFCNLDLDSLCDMNKLVVIERALGQRQAFAELRRSLHDSESRFPDQIDGSLTDFSGATLERHCD